MRAMRTFALATVLIATAARAHFLLLSPPPMYQQGPFGDPQKAAPCGADGTEVPSGATVQTYAPGNEVPLIVRRTPSPPGHYRAAQGGPGPDSRPPEPDTDAGGGCDCGTGVIQDPPVYPVLADDLLEHDAMF